MNLLLFAIAGGLRLLRDDIDNPRDGVTAVERGRSTTHNLNAVNISQRNGVPVHAAVKGSIEHLSVIHDENICT